MKTDSVQWAADNENKITALMQLAQETEIQVAAETSSLAKLSELIQDHQVTIPAFVDTIRSAIEKKLAAIHERFLTGFTSTTVSELTNAMKAIAEEMAYIEHDMSSTQEANEQRLQQISSESEAILALGYDQDIKDAIATITGQLQDEMQQPLLALKSRYDELDEYYLQLQQTYIALNIAKASIVASGFTGFSDIPVTTAVSVDSIAPATDDTTVETIVSSPDKSDAPEKRRMDYDASSKIALLLIDNPGQLFSIDDIVEFLGDNTRRKVGATINATKHGRSSVISTLLAEKGYKLFDMKESGLLNDSQRQILMIGAVPIDTHEVKSDTVDTIAVAEPIEKVADESPNYELLLSRLPSLEGKIKGPDSIHRHKYDDSNTVSVLAEQALETPVADRTALQIQLLNDIETMKLFLRQHETSYKTIYSPEELHELVVKLMLLKQKNRPDFGDVEAAILDVLRHDGTTIKDSRLKGYVSRAENDQPSRKGMTWGSLSELAYLANQVLTSRLTGIDQSQYMMAVSKDPEADMRGMPDLTNVYQFVISNHIYDVLGKRNIEVKDARERTFLDNCDIINTWYEQARAVIEEISRIDGINKKINTVAEDQRKARPIRHSLKFQISHLIDCINERKDGDRHLGNQKSYKYNAVTAIKQQLLLMHWVNQIRKALEEGIVSHEEQITPLNFEDL